MFFFHNEFAILAVPQYLQKETVSEGQSGIIQVSKAREREIERGRDESAMVRQGTPRLRSINGWVKLEKYHTATESRINLKETAIDDNTSVPTTSAVQQAQNKPQPSLLYEQQRKMSDPKGE